MAIKGLEKALFSRKKLPKPCVALKIHSEPNGATHIGAMSNHLPSGLICRAVVGTERSSKAETAVEITMFNFFKCPIVFDLLVEQLR